MTTKYFAEIKNNKVVRVIVSSQNIINKNYLGEWIETKYNQIDDNFACIGYNYNRIKKKFIPEIPKDIIMDSKTFRHRLNSNNKLERYEINTD